MTATTEPDSPVTTSPVHAATGVVVGFDNTPAGTAALRWAAAWAYRESLPMHVVHVHEAPSGPARMLELDVHDALRLARQRVFGLVCQRLADATNGDGSLVSVSVVEGRVGPELSQAAEGAELLVIGEASSLEHVNLGDELSSEASCPVAVIREDGAAHLLPARSSVAVTA